MCEDDEGTKQFLEPYRRFYLLKNKGIEWMKYGHTLFSQLHCQAKILRLKVCLNNCWLKRSSLHKMLTNHGLNDSEENVSLLEFEGVVQ